MREGRRFSTEMLGKRIAVCSRHIRTGRQAGLNWLGVVVFNGVQNGLCDIW